MPTVEELEAEVSRLKSELSTAKRDLDSTKTDLGKYQETATELRGKIKEVNDEAKGHRLNADNFRRTSEDLKAQLEEATTKATTLADQHKTALEAIRGEHGTALETIKAELTGKLTEAETKAATALTGAQKKALQADLRVAATLAGMLDLDGLKLVDESKIELDDDGNLKNGDALMATLKEGKAFLFSKEPPPPPKPASSGNPDPTPQPKTPSTKKATEMTDAEYAAALAHISRYGKPPS
jgi:hypothetical protein